jgi:hypothetical protein
MSRPDPAYALHKAVYEALTAAGVEHVFHDVPHMQPLPYVTIGDDEIDSDYEAGPHSRATVNIAIFARTKPIAKTLWRDVRAALDLDIAMEDFAVFEGRLEDVRFVKQPDGQSEGVYARFSYLIIPDAA